jgi:hypothetical protein
MIASDELMELSGEEKSFTLGLSSYPSSLRSTLLCIVGRGWVGCCISIHLSFCFIYPFASWSECRGERMKNLQNYAKNVQLVKRNIILCVACFYIASFPRWIETMREERKGEIRARRWAFGEDDGKGENEWETMSIMKYILLKWRRGKRRETRHGDDKKGLPDKLSCYEEALECGKFRKLSFRIASRPRRFALSPRRDLSDNTARNLHLVRGRKVMKRKQQKSWENPFIYLQIVV